MANPKIVVDKEVKETLDKMKKYPRSTYNDVLRRILRLDKTIERGYKKK